jgi:cytochrome P450
MASMPTPADQKNNVPLSFPLPRPRGRPFDPPTELMRLQVDQPAARIRLWSGNDAWLFTRYEDVRKVLSDPSFSSDARHPNFPHESPGLVAHRKHERMLITMDPPEHTHLRRVLARSFLLRQLELMRPRIQEIADELIDDLDQAKQPADLITGYALPLPGLAVSGFLGVPPEDRHFFTSLVERIADMSISHDESRAANSEFSDYIRRLLDRKETEPGEDVITSLLKEHKANGTLTREDVVANVRLILVAAFESTADQIALGVLLLLHHADQRAKLEANFGLIETAVEEILRFGTIDQYGRRRVAVVDVEVGGQLVRAGDGVVVSQSTANRDESVFANGNEFDITREEARSHVAFSYGVHQCLGQALARIELQVAFKTLFQRVATLRLAVPIEQLSFKHGQALYGVDTLPVVWEPGSIVRTRSASGE